MRSGEFLVFGSERIRFQVLLIKLRFFLIFFAGFFQRLLLPQKLAVSALELGGLGENEGNYNGYVFGVMLRSLIMLGKDKK